MNALRGIQRTCIRRLMCLFVAQRNEQHRHLEIWHATLSGSKSTVERNRVFQPYFLAASAAICIALALLGTLAGKGVEYWSLALGSFVLTAISSVSVFVVWRAWSSNEKWLFFGTLLSGFVVYPVVWLVLQYLLSQSYAHVVTTFREGSILFEVTIWGALIKLFDDGMPLMHSVLLLYSAVRVSRWIQNSAFLKTASIVFVGVSALYFCLWLALTGDRLL